MMAGEHVLVTGGAGMIGCNLVARIRRSGRRVSVVDNLWRGKIEYLLDGNGVPLIDLERDFHRLDLAVPGVLDSLLENVDYVFHLADIVAGIGYVFNNQSSIFRENFLINSNVIASVSRHLHIKGYVYAGTACSFPAYRQTGVDAPPLREEDQYPAAPESAYGWSKLMGEYEAGLMEQEHGIPVGLVVLHNVYGSPCDYSRERSQVIPSLIRKAILHPAEPFLVWGSGQQGRAFVHVDDAVDALLATLERGLGRGPIQIGPDYCTSIAEIAETVVDISGKDIAIHYDRSRPEGDRGRCADFSKARHILGWEPRVDQRTGVSRLYSWIERRLG